MFRERLLTKLTNLESPTLEKVGDRTLVISSVINYLTRLLNTRRGTVSIDPSYGLADMANLAGTFSQGSSYDITNSIIEQIELYEPRLMSPRLEPINESKEIITLGYVLYGRVDFGINTKSIEDCKMKLRINSAGKISIEALNEF